MKTFFGVLIPGLIFIFLTFPAIAASIITGLDQSEIKAEEFLTTQVKLNISAKDGTAYYLRGVFYQPGTTSYCGYTWNGGSWFSGPYSSSSNQGWKNFLKVAIKSSSWSGELRAKIDPQDYGCRESGNYAFKIQRFTESGSSISDPQQEKYIDIIIPTLTPVPTDVPTQTVIPTENDPTTIPTPKLFVTVKPTVRITSKLIPTGTKKEAKANQHNSGNVLGSEDKTKVTPTPSFKLKKTEVLGTSSNNLVAKIFITIGTVLLVVCAILTFRSFRNRRKELI